MASSSSARELIHGGAAGHPLHVDERLVQAIWHDQMLRGNELATASGKRLEVIEPGRWNTSAGPDFLDARIRLASEVITGDIEIHVDSAAWRQHRHHQDFEYNRVVLHVVLNAHDDRPYEEKQNGERLERLVLSGFLEPDLDTIRASVNPADYPHGRPSYLGLCHEQFLRLPESQLIEFLLVAGRSRFEQKIARFAAQRSTAPFLQVLYQTIMTGQGFKSSKTLYFLLSKRAPVEELFEHGRDFPREERTDFFLATLLHVANLADVQPDALAEFDDESQAYLQRIRDYWRAVRPYFSDRLIPPTRRWFAGVRPAGFPQRRLAAVAILLARIADRREPLYDHFREAVRNSVNAPLERPREAREFWKKLIAPILVDDDRHYFATRFTLGGKKQKPQALLGEPAAASLIFNVMLPMVVVEAREKRDRALEKAAMALVYTHPALEKNSIVRFMENRLFGDTAIMKSLASREIIQQSMLKIFADCCSHNERTCDDCTFLALGERIAAGHEAGATTS